MLKKGPHELSPKVNVKDVKTKFEGGAAQDIATQFGEKMLSVESIRRLMEKAISDKATEIATRMAKAKTNQALAQVGMGT